MKPFSPNRSFLFSALVALTLGVATAPAADWPEWGYDSSKNMVQPNAKDLPVTLKPGTAKPGTEEIDLATTENVVWVAKLGSQSYGNPTVAQGKVFVGTNNESPRDPEITGDRGNIYCFDEKTGEFLWQLVVPKLGAGKVSDWEYIGICSSPTVDGDRVYIVTNRCEIMCLDINGLADGNQGPFMDEATYYADRGQPPVKLHDKLADIIWVYDMRNELGVFPHNTTSNSILIVGDKLFTATSNGMDWSHTNIPNPSAPALVCLDKNTGKLLGEDGSGVSARVLHANWSSPAYGEIDGVGQVIWGGGDGWAYGFGLDAKKDDEGFDILPELWRFDANPASYWKDADGNPIRYATALGPSEIISTAVVYDGKAYFAIGQDPEHGDGVGAITCVDPSKRGDITKSGKVWQYTGIGRTISTPSIADGLVFIAEYAGKVHALDAQTGEAYGVYDTKSRIWGSTLVADGKVYIGDEDGELIVLSADKELKELGKVNMGAPVYSSPVATDDTVFVATQTHLYAISKTAPKADE
ncbi:MAG: PQQ-binding-like beta-propeller repeat protein [Verrucomicrobiota bacterium]